MGPVKPRHVTPTGGAEPMSSKEPGMRTRRQTLGWATSIAGVTGALAACGRGAAEDPAKPAPGTPPTEVTFWNKPAHPFEQGFGAGLVTEFSQRYPAFRMNAQTTSGDMIGKL